MIRAEAFHVLKKIKLPKHTFFYSVTIPTCERTSSTISHKYHIEKGLRASRDPRSLGHEIIQFYITFFLTFFQNSLSKLIYTEDISYLGKRVQYTIVRSPSSRRNAYALSRPFFNPCLKKMQMISRKKRALEFYLRKTLSFLRDKNHRNS